MIFPVCAPRLLKGRDDLTPSGLADFNLLHELRKQWWADWLSAAGVAGVEDWRGTTFQNHLAIEAAEAGQGFALSDQILGTDSLLDGWLARPFSFDLKDHWHYWIVRGKGQKESPAGQGVSRMADGRDRGYQQEICTTDRTEARKHCGKARLSLASGACSLRN